MKKAKHFFEVVLVSVLLIAGTPLFMLSGIVFAWRGTFTNEPKSVGRLLGFSLLKFQPKLKVYITPDKVLFDGCSLEMPKEILKMRVNDFSAEGDTVVIKVYNEPHLLRKMGKGEWAHED